MFHLAQTLFFFPAFWWTKIKNVKDLNFRLTRSNCLFVCLEAPVEQEKDQLFTLLHLGYAYLKYARNNLLD